MPKAVLRNGVIYPLEPLPVEWSEGQELEVRESTDDAAEADAWFAEMETLVANLTPEDDARLQAAIDEARRLEKERVRASGGKMRLVSCWTQTT